MTLQRLRIIAHRWEKRAAGSGDWSKNVLIVCPARLVLLRLAIDPSQEPVMNITSGTTVDQLPLEAISPFELRVNLGRSVPDSDVRTALATGEMGFLHSFTTASTLDGPGVRVVAWTTGCMWRCRYCHNPDTWTLSNGIPVTVVRATEQMGRYKWHRLGLPYTLEAVEPPSTGLVEKACAAFRAVGLRAH
jgi:hypothetical protein